MNRLSPGTFFGNTGKTRSLNGLRVQESYYAPNLKLAKHCHSENNAFVVVDGVVVENGKHFFHRNAFVYRAGDYQHDSLFGDRTVYILNIAIDDEWIRSRIARPEQVPKVSRLLNANAASLSRRLFYEFLMNDVASALSIESIVLELFAQVCRANESNNLESRAKWLDRVREMVHEKAATGLSVGCIANEVGVHPSHLARTFRRVFGVTLGDYLRSTRLDQAAGLLAKSSMSICEVAGKCGFSDQSHLTRLFRRQFGVTPSVYRSRCA